MTPIDKFCLLSTSFIWNQSQMHSFESGECWYLCMRFECVFGCNCYLTELSYRISTNFFEFSRYKCISADTSFPWNSHGFSSVKLHWLKSTQCRERQGHVLFFQWKASFVLTLMQSSGQRYNVNELLINFCLLSMNRMLNSVKCLSWKMEKKNFSLTLVQWIVIVYYWITLAFL